MEWWMRATRRFTESADINPALERYSVKAITGGTDALGEVSCLVREDGMTVAGQGAHSDIVMASALALVNALNRLQGACSASGGGERGSDNGVGLSRASPHFG